MRQPQFNYTFDGSPAIALELEQIFIRTTSKLTCLTKEFQFKTHTLDVCFSENILFGMFIGLTPENPLYNFSTQQKLVLCYVTNTCAETEMWLE